MGSAEHKARARARHTSTSSCAIRRRRRTVSLSTSGLPSHWVLSFCYGTVCNPFKVSFALPAGATKRVELLVAPLNATDGPWTMTVNAGGQPHAVVQVNAKTAKA